MSNQEPIFIGSRFNSLHDRIALDDHVKREGVIAWLVVTGHHFNNYSIHLVEQHKDEAFIVCLNQRDIELWRYTDWVGQNGSPLLHNKKVMEWLGSGAPFDRCVYEIGNETEPMQSIERDLLSKHLHIATYLNCAQAEVASV
jgi:hypothetical protein